MKELNLYIYEKLKLNKDSGKNIPQDDESFEYIQYLFEPFEKDFSCEDCREREDERIAALEPLTKKAHDSISKYTGYKFSGDDDYDYIFIGKYDNEWYGILEYNYEKDKASDMVGDFLGPQYNLDDLLDEFCEKLGF